MSKDQSLLPDVLLAYYKRIGAEVLNFRRAMVRKYKGNYYSERALIKIDTEGNIECRNKEYAPSEAESATIKAALSASADFPKGIEATFAGAEKYMDLMGIEGYIFVSRDSGGVIMIQERRITDDGGKIYVPHTLFSDGIWRTMEPDGKLPFWKPRENRGLPRIMIHEGAKSAAFVDHLLHNGESHPWKEELAEYEHWGAIGGALAPHRCNYAEIWKERPSEVVYVADNDIPGKTALHEFSRHFGGPLKGVLFDERWPESWDLADPMPPRMFAGERFIGPMIREIMIPATWATEEGFKEEGTRGRAPYKLKREFADEWYHCIRPEVYVHRDFIQNILNLQEFNNCVRPFSNVDDVARLVKAELATKSMLLLYMPGMKTGMRVIDGTMCLNTHVPSPIKPEKGDIGPFIEFMEHLIPNDTDRHELLRWCATLIAKPDIKMLYGVLLVSEVQGVGKGTLGEKILTPLVGSHNTSFPTESDIVDSNYNYWCAHKRLAVVHEIYAGHSSKAYNKLKSIITDKYITVSRKYQANYEVENWVHVFACSNSYRAIQLSIDDRRWFVPKVTSKKKSDKYWISLNQWLTDSGGLNIIKWWAKEWLKVNPVVLRGETSPWSEAKRDIVEEGYSTGMQFTAKFLERIKNEMPDDLIIMTDYDLVQLVRDHVYEGKHNEKLERPATLRKVAKAAGWFISERRIRHNRWGLWRSGSYIITNSPDLAGADPATVDGPPLDLRKVSQGWI